MKIHYVPAVLLLGSAVVILLLAGGLLLKGRAVRRSAQRFRSRAVPATATVVGLEAKDLSLGSDPDTRYFPRVSFVPEGATEPVEARPSPTSPHRPLAWVTTSRSRTTLSKPGHVDVASTQDAAEGAGRTWFLLAALVAVVGVGVAAACLLLVVLVGTG